MLRRSVLLLAAGGIGGAWFVSRDEDGDIRESISDGFGAAAEIADGGTPTPVTFPHKESLADPFKHIEYFEDGTAKLSFVDFHEVDGWILMYHQYDEIDRAMHVCEAPDSSRPTVTINLIELIQAQNTEYPDRRFNLIAAKGAFDGCSYQNRFNLITERVHTATIHIPPEFTISTTPTPTAKPDDTPTPDDGNTTVGFD